MSSSPFLTPILLRMTSFVDSLVILSFKTIKQEKSLLLNEDLSLLLKLLYMLTWRSLTICNEIRVIWWNLFGAA
ncbi:hypothetical protein NL676_010448 [Syzygium grande]|nr:hypothetical protein NL676_010448 [Syzygium grande]